VNTNNGVKWRRFILPKKVEQIIMTTYSYTLVYKSSKIKVSVNDMTVNDSEMCVDEKTKFDQYRRYQS